MYLEHFKIREFPFTLTPNPKYFCELPGHQAALNVLLVSLRNGEGFIKIVGEVGAGKTLLCRLTLEYLDPNFYSTYIPNPDLTPNGLRRAFAKELGIELEAHLDAEVLLEKITARLLDLNRKGKRVVLIIDEAQTLTDDCLEAIRLLTNLETATTKLLQVVLFAQPELDTRLKLSHLRQLAQRITFSYYLAPVRKEDLNAYICHRLAKSGYTYGQLFTPAAQKVLFKNSHGLPRLINIFAHKAMMVAYGRGESKISKQSMLNAVNDSHAQSELKAKIFVGLALTASIMAIVAAIVIKFHGSSL